MEDFMVKGKELRIRKYFVLFFFKGKVDNLVWLNGG